MDKEFNYFITGILARRSGFSSEESCVIAHSCQLVDDNKNLGVIKNKKDDAVYEVYISQTYDIFKPKDDLMRIYSIFHFLPGDPLAPRPGGATGKCTY